MSCKMNWRRLSRVLSYDLHRCSILRWRRTGSTGMYMLVIMLLPMVLALSSVALGTYTFCSVSSRWALILLCILSIMVLVPELLYGSINLKQGISYAMLPATKQEKFLSMVLMTLVVCPLTAFFGMFVIDTVITLLPINVFHHFLWQEHYPLAGFGIKNLQGSEWYFVYRLLVLVFGFVVAGMGFTLGNILFRKNKTAMTLLCFVVFGFLVSILMMVLRSSVVPAGIGNSMAYRIGGVISGSFFGWLFRIDLVLQLILTTLFTWFSWKKIKNMGY